MTGIPMSSLFIKPLHDNKEMKVLREAVTKMKITFKILSNMDRQGGNGAYKYYIIMLGGGGQYSLDDNDYTLRGG